MSERATVARRHAARARRTVQRIVARACATVALASACAPQRPALADLPASTGGAPSALLVLRSTECDANIGVLHVFERPAIRRGVLLVGVVLLDGDSAATRVRSQMRAFDVGAPLLRPSRATRDSLAAITRAAGPAIVVRDAHGTITHVLAAPQSPSQLRRLVESLTAIAARSAAVPD